MGCDHDPTFGKKRDFFNACWAATVERHEEGTLDQRLWHDIPEEFLEYLKDTEGPTQASSASAQGQSASASDAGPEGAPPEETKETELPDPDSANLRRIVEEAEALDILEAMNWIDCIPETPFHLNEQNKLYQQCQEYIDSFEDKVWTRWDTGNLCLSTRVWAVELRWTYQALFARDLAHKDLRFPKDRWIRDAASAHPLFQDPGNYCLDVVVHILRLFDWVSATSVDQVTRLGTKEYGSAPSKSAKGPVNLRGNMVEALAHHAQVLGTTGRVKGLGGKGAPGSSSTPKPVAAIPPWRQP